MPESQRQITIAIDGFSACGKSTLAIDLASRLGYLHIDSGAMYRAVTLYFLQHDIDIANRSDVEAALLLIDIRFKRVGTNAHTILNGADVESDIRSIEVSDFVSPVAAISAVRRLLVRQQQNMGRGKGIVMDGRDIGTVVFPTAELKLFMTASLNERINRRTLDLRIKGIDATPEEIEKSIVERDRIDSTRADSPLRQDEDAVLLDNTNLDRQEQLELAYTLAESKIEADSP